MRIVICDDHRLFAEAMAIVLEHRGHEVVACTADPAEAARAVRLAGVDLCIMDLQFPGADGVTGTAAVLEASPATKVVVLSAITDFDRLSEALAAGASGIAVKGDRVDRVLDVVERVHAGELVISGATRRPVSHKPPAQARAQELARFLTTRERQVLERLVRGESSADIATAMNVRYSTVRTHIQNVLNKLGVHSKLEAVVFAVNNGVVAIDDVA